VRRVSEAAVKTPPLQVAAAYSWGVVSSLLMLPRHSLIKPVRELIAHYLGRTIRAAGVVCKTIVQSVAANENKTCLKVDVDADSFDEADIGHMGEKASWS